MTVKPTPLETKPDWPEAVKRWESFWRDEVPEDRVLMAIYVPRKDNPYPRPDNPENLEEFHTDLDSFIARKLREVYGRHYLAEAIPSTWNSITGGYLGILLGGHLKPMEKGVIWSEPYIDNWNSIDSLQIDRSCKWHKITMEQLSLLVEHKDKFLTRIPDFHGISDALVSIRGAENLAMDLFDNPDIIEWACSQILDAWEEAYEEVNNFLQKFQAGNVIWFRMWHPGKIEAIQEDFCELVSIEQYERHFRKFDQEFSRKMDCAMFHLHNTMTRYQEIALDMPEISGTQFRLPYDDSRKPEPIKNHLQLFDKMHVSGKKTWYQPVDENDMKDAILNSDPRHLFLEIYAPDEDNARYLMDKACEWTQKRIRELGLS